MTKPLVDSERRGRRRAPLVLALATVVSVGAILAAPGPVGARERSSTAVAPSGPVASPGDGTIPDTPAGRQLRWLIDSSGHLPVAEDEVRAHVVDVAKPASAQIAAQFNALLVQLTAGAPLRFVRVRAQVPQVLRAELTSGVGRIDALVVVDSAGLIASFSLRAAPPTAPAPASWADVDAAVRPLAPHVQLLVAESDTRRPGACRPLHGLDATTPGPLGSEFKLLVLGALAEQIATGRHSWSENVVVRPELKSLPSGILQYEPDRTVITLDNVAAKMISISDNTAADHVAALTGRRAIEGAQRGLGVADPERNRPFLRTRELFNLKLNDWPTGARAYLDASRHGRRDLLPSIDAQPLATADVARTWTEPRAIDDLEWFASPADLCRVYESLARLDARSRDHRIDQVLSLNDGSLGLDPERWPRVWFKGGSEPGVLDLAFRAVDRQGRAVVVAVALRDPDHAVDEAKAVPPLLDAVRAAFARA